MSIHGNGLRPCGAFVVDKRWSSRSELLPSYFRFPWSVGDAGAGEVSGVLGETDHHGATLHAMDGKASIMQYMEVVFICQVRSSVFLRSNCLYSAIQYASVSMSCEECCSYLLPLCLLRG